MRVHLAIQQTRDIHTVLFQCWPIVLDAGPTVKQHWVNDSSLLGISYLPFSCWRRGSPVFVYKNGESSSLLVSSCVHNTNNFICKGSLFAEDLVFFVLLYLSHANLTDILSPGHPPSGSTQRWGSRCYIPHGRGP